ncbi:hypothetical protein JIR001_18920 [Polycladomyces abyssicola]|uniref:ATP-grasp domain-containing protein n=2 Tax=Polycladomyces abyssicola TaxID=1125966 RepID=A0A8D5ZL35_9BACL|nr:hypothetical protein JIR001_18920 [Polycladomyces abyssicola]
MLGYVGVAGFDIVITQEGDCYVLDLNFRLNGSSVVLLLRDRIEEVYGDKANDPKASPYRDAQGYLSGLFLGDSREDVDHLNEQLILEGIGC